MSVESLRVCHSVKRDGQHKSGRPLIEAVAATLRRDHREAFADFLGPDVTLVPVPKSAPLPKGGGPVLWVPSRICEALVAAGLGRAVVPCVERVRAVPKSAFAGRGERPSLKQHIESMRATLDLPAGRIALVDDVVTKGTTFLAAATVLTSTLPTAAVRAFALIRTCGLVANVDRIIDPAVGTITRDRWGNVDRQP